MKTPILAIDIDDTLADTARSVMAVLCQKTESKQPVERLLAEYRQPGSVTSWQTEELQSLIHSLISSESFLASLPVIDDALESVRQLAGTIPIGCYITSRPDAVRTVTQEWLDQHSFPPAPLITRSTTEHRPNWKIHTLIERYPATHHVLLIDDSVEAFLDTPSEFNGTKVLLSRWARYPSTIDFQAASSWPDLVSIIKNIIV